MGQYIQESDSAFVYYSEKGNSDFGNVDYRSHTRPLFYQWKTLDIYDIVNFKSVVFVFKVYGNLLQANMLSCFNKKVSDSHNHNTRNPIDSPYFRLILTYFICPTF